MDRTVNRIRIAYISNEFPNLTESYVVKEIEVLRRRGIDVLCYSTKRPRSIELPMHFRTFFDETTYLRPFKPLRLIKAAWFAVRLFEPLKDIYLRVLFHGKEGFFARLKGIGHVWQGIYLSLFLKPEGITHIHAHHGYFASFGAMVVSRVLNIPYSITLHGSDLLIDRFYLDLKLNNCKMCFTISDYNRRFLIDRFPSVPPDRVIVRRMGVEETPGRSVLRANMGSGYFVILSVGRLSPVKNYQFLIEACAKLKESNFGFMCLIVGGGQEKTKLQRLIERRGLNREVKLLDVVDRPFVHVFYQIADLVVLTSRSEGIPLVLMEAMRCGRIVLAPEITGIPELVLDGQTGFLYRVGDLQDFLAKVALINEMSKELNEMRNKAREHVIRNYDEATNLERFTNVFLGMMDLRGSRNENSNL
jgi:colanic acid/amylovoran biosynthesis glycosyltransferase